MRQLGFGLFLICAVLVVIFFLSTSHYQPQTFYEGIEGQNISEYLKKNRMSASWEIWADGKQAGKGWTGFHNLSDQSSIKDSTAFNLGSVSKQFTGYLFWLAINRKLLTPSDLAVDLVPQLDRRNFSSISVEHLMRMTSGLPNNFGFFDFLRPQFTSRIYSDRDFVVWLNQYELLSKPGREYRYSNLGYNLLAIILANAAKKPWAELVENEIFSKCHMQHAWVEGVQGGRPTNLARPYVSIFNRLLELPRWNYSMIRGAGAIVASTSNLALWQQCLTKNVTSDFFNFDGHDYSHGWFQGELKNEGVSIPIFEHDGEDPGYNALTIRTQDGKSFAVFQWNTDITLLDSKLSDFWKFIEPILVKAFSQQRNN